MNDKRFVNEDTIDLLDLARKLLRFWWLLLLALIIGAGAACGYSMEMITPMYKAEAMIYVNNGSITVGSTSVSLQDLDASQSLVDTYMVILKSRNVLMDVAEELNLDYSYETMKELVSASKVSDTEVFSIYVTSADPKEAEQIVNTIAELLPEKIGDIVEGSSVKIVDYAVVPTQKISPNIKKNTMMGGFALFIIVAAILVLRILLDNTIQDETDVYDLTKAPILAKIPELARNNSNGQVIPLGDNVPFTSREAYRLLRTNVLYSLPYSEKGHAIGITSSVASEFKSTVAINLAIRLAAEQDKKVLLLDCDLRMSEIAERLQIGERAGLTEHLTSDVALKDVIHPLSDYPGLYVIVSGGVSPNPGDLLRSLKMRETLESLRDHFDYIVCDLPPANIVSDAMELGTSCDGLLLVARQNYVVKSALEEAIHKLDFLSINVLGLVLTGVDPGKKYGKKYYYSKYYGNNDKKKRKK